MLLTRYLLLLWLAVTGLPAWSLDGDPNVDPWESFNRTVFAFNETLDKYVLLPAARGYRFVTPDPAERGVSNFIANIYEVNSVLNSLLQGRVANAATSGARFLVNTTVGLFGLIDVATEMGIEHSPADFDQTLHTWGVTSGPYLMLPVFGPRTVRSAAGGFIDTRASIPSMINDQEWAYLFWTLEVLDVRAGLIKADELVTGDRYIFIRNAYLQRRAVFLSGGVIEDSFMEPEDEDFVDF